MKKRMKKKRKNFNTIMSEGDAVIRIRENKTVELVFAEDTETVIREMAWPEHEVYKTAVQFALMIDSYFKNAEGLDNLILNSPTGNIAAELLGKDLLQISLAGVADVGEIEVNNIADKSDTVKQEGKDVSSGKLKDNILDLTNKLKNKEDDDKKK